MTDPRPDVPSLEILDGWYVGVPTSWRRAVDGGTMRLWKPSRTVLLDRYDPGSEPTREAWEHMVQAASEPPPPEVGASDAELLFLERGHEVARHAHYRRRDSHRQPASAVSTVVADDVLLMVANIYFDHPADRGWATAVARSLGKTPPTDPALVDRLPENGWMVKVERGADLAALSHAEFRPGDFDAAGDSGFWFATHGGVNDWEPEPLAKLLHFQPAARQPIQASGVDDIPATWVRTAEGWARQ